MAEHESILDELTARRREIHAQLSFAVSERLSGPRAEEWAPIFTMFTHIEEPTKGLLDALAKFLPKPAGNLYPLTVDYSRTVADGIRAGRYDYVNSDITARHFPTTRTGTHEEKVELMHLDRDISTEDALREMDAHGYRPADLHELLAFGEKYPEIQREFPVVALGSVWRSRAGSRYVPSLDGDGTERDLGLEWDARDWDAGCRFAVVRK